MTLSVDRLISRAWGLYKGHWRHLVPVAGAVYIVVTLLSALFLSAIGQSGTLPALALSLAGFFLVQGPASVAVLDVLDGTADMTVGETISRGFARWRQLLPAALVAGAVIAVGFVLIVPGLILLTIWAVVGPVAVLEDRTGVLATLGRSRELVRGNGWQVFTIIIAVLLLGVLAGLLIATPLSLLGLAPGAVQLVGQLVTAVLVVPFSAIAAVLVYLGLREGRGEPPPDGGPGRAGADPPPAAA